jgi:hypothetical protein
MRESIEAHLKDEINPHWLAGIASCSTAQGGLCQEAGPTDPLAKPLVC